MTKLTPSQIGQLSRTLAFFASVIKSGESWSPTCEDAHFEAKGILEQLGQQTAAPGVGFRITAEQLAAMRLDLTKDYLEALADGINALAVAPPPVRSGVVQDAQKFVDARQGAALTSMEFTCMRFARALLALSPPPVGLEKEDGTPTRPDPTVSEDIRSKQ